MSARQQVFSILMSNVRQWAPIARRAGVSHSVISNWLTMNRTPRLDTLEAVMREMGYRIEFVKDERQ